MILDQIIKEMCIYVTIYRLKINVLDQDLEHIRSPPPKGGFAIVFFCKVIGCLYHIRMPPAVPGELFGPRVEKNLIYI